MHFKFTVIYFITCTLFVQVMIKLELMPFYYVIGTKKTWESD